NQPNILKIILYGLFFLFLAMPSIQTKLARYRRLHIQLEKLLSESPSFVSQLATINALLYHKISYIFWVGVYILEHDQLIVGPYQGPLACQTLPHPNGACWHAILHRKALIIPDVLKFPGHIACDSRSKSELVIPIYFPDNRIFGVFDLDSDNLNAFDKVDEEEILNLIKLIHFDP
ncbi:MAG: GAF domain-containing protein, partial [Alphaproteobacteria bacterium]